MKEGGKDSKERIAYAFRWATSRMPDQEELNILVGLFEDEMAEFQNHPERAAAFLQIGEFSSQDELNAQELAAYGVVANTIINLSESLQKN